MDDVFTANVKGTTVVNNGTTVVNIDSCTRTGHDSGASQEVRIQL